MMLGTLPAWIERNCGATAPFTTLVSLRDAHDRFDPDAADNWLVVVSGRTTLKLRWAGTRHLVISGAGSPLNAKSSWREVRVSYE
jgi:hypothetical protein